MIFHFSRCDLIRESAGAQSPPLHALPQLVGAIPRQERHNYPQLHLPTFVDEQGMCHAPKEASQHQSKGAEQCATGFCLMGGDGFEDDGSCCADNHFLAASECNPLCASSVMGTGVPSKQRTRADVPSHVLPLKAGALKGERTNTSQISLSIPCDSCMPRTMLGSGSSHSARQEAATTQNPGAVFHAARSVKRAMLLSCILILCLTLAASQLMSHSAPTSVTVTQAKRVRHFGRKVVRQGQENASHLQVTPLIDIHKLPGEHERRSRDTLPWPHIRDHSRSPRSIFSFQLQQNSTNSF